MKLPAFITQRSKREIIGFLGSGIVAVAVSGWAVFTHFYPTPPAPTTSIQDRYRICDNDDPSTCPADAVVVPKGTIRDHIAKDCDDLKRKLANSTVAPTSVHDINCITKLSNDAVESQSHYTDKGTLAPAIVRPAMKTGGASGLVR